MYSLNEPLILWVNNPPQLVPWKLSSHLIFWRVKIYSFHGAPQIYWKNREQRGEINIKSTITNKSANDNTRITSMFVIWTFLENDSSKKTLSKTWLLRKHATFFYLSFDLPASPIVYLLRHGSTYIRMYMYSYAYTSILCAFYLLEKKKEKINQRTTYIFLIFYPVNALYKLSHFFYRTPAWSIFLLSFLSRSWSLLMKRCSQKMCCTHQTMVPLKAYIIYSYITKTSISGVEFLRDLRLVTGRQIDPNSFQNEL